MCSILKLPLVCMSQHFNSSLRRGKTSVPGTVELKPRSNKFKLLFKDQSTIFWGCSVFLVQYFWMFTTTPDSCPISAKIKLSWQRLWEVMVLSAGLAWDWSKLQVNRMSLWTLSSSIPSAKHASLHNGDIFLTKKTQQATRTKIQPTSDACNSSGKSWECELHPSQKACCRDVSCPNVALMEWSRYTWLDSSNTRLL